MYFPLVGSILAQALLSHILHLCATTLLERAVQAQAFRFRKAPLVTPACGEGTPGAKRAAPAACCTAAQGVPEPPLRTLTEPLTQTRAPAARAKRAASDAAVLDSAAAAPAAEEAVPRKRARRKGEPPLLACLRVHFSQSYIRCLGAEYSQLCVRAAAQGSAGCVR